MYNTQLTFERIKHLAKIKNISLNSLQEQCGLSPNTIKVSSKGENGLRAKNLYLIAEHLNCSIDYLLGRSNCPTLYNHMDEQTALDSSVTNVASASFSDDISDIVDMLKKLSLVDRAKAIVYINQMLEHQ